jgi:hypothetical protein
LGNFECVGEACALVVFGKDEDLGLAGKAAKRSGVQDAITVTLEAGTKWIGFFVDGAVAGTG